jgi:subtilisin-like proprotein convertase family protein
MHKQVSPLPPNTRLAIDYVTASGRGGKGCVVLFAAGNGNESVDNDGYASYPRVTAVAACNDRGKRSVYSDFGKAVWCAFPSDDMAHLPSNHPAPLTPGIWTTDRQGEAGYNSGLPSEGDVPGNYTNSFGGTSSACPGAAGIAALILSVNPALKWQEVKELLKRSCDKIDPSGGQYDAAGHSPLYGYGRLNALTAVQLAKPQPQSAITIKRTFDAPIPDMTTVTAALEVADNTSVESLSVGIDIRHTFIGDLVVTLEPPAGIGVAPVVLHDRAGGSANKLKKQYDAATTPTLAKFAGKGCKGTWTLKVRDAAQGDSGTLVSFSLLLSFPHTDRIVAPPRIAVDRPIKAASRKVAQMSGTVTRKARSRSKEPA